ncbi:MAG: nucleotide exchange factor GrpE [Polyangia bacterium]|jgi:molecular chaperone GrpE|nr:nucleotide exchange factor GrpE [Polyangia bacterium]
MGDNGFKKVDRRTSLQGEDEGGAGAEASGQRAEGALGPDDKPTYVKQLEERTRRAEEQLAKYIQAYKSEVDGEFQKRLERLQREAQRELDRLRGELAMELVEVLDNFDRSLDAIPAGGAQAGLRQGLVLVREQFMGALGRMGVSKVPAMGLPFDPRMHEATAMAPVADPADDGKVVVVLKEGYLLGERVIRAAMVQVGRFTE